jgi:hypothetical protein
VLDNEFTYEGGEVEGHDIMTYDTKEKFIFSGKSPWPPAICKKTAPKMTGAGFRRDPIWSG